MRDSARAAFLAFTSPLEGVVEHLYLDVKGLVTTGIGNLVDPMAYALTLPFVKADGSYASRDEIAAEWQRVKLRQDMKMAGGGAFAKVTTLRLTREGINALVMRKLDQNDDVLGKRFANFDELPADAQLALHSLAWACGANFHFPELEASVRACDFDAAAVQCKMNTDGPDHIPGTADDNRGLIPRNAADELLFRNAARVNAFKLDPDVLWWPRALGDVSPEAETKPNLPVLEDDGGLSRQDATTDAIDEAAEKAVDDDADSSFTKTS